jgi:hypothetical protein
VVVGEVSISAAEWAFVALGIGFVILGLRGLPGMRRMLRSPRVAGTWRHGALVFLAIIYSMTMPTLGVIIVLVAIG